MKQPEISTNEKVINYIIEKIENQTYKEGSKLPSEQNLSDILSVSRNSVREALKTLQYLKLINSTKGSGYTISDSLEESMGYILNLIFNIFHYTYFDISNIREGLELKSFLLIQKSKVTNEDIKQLNTYIDNMEQGVSPVENDLNFHLKLSKLSGNNLIYRMTLALSKISEKYILIPWDDMDKNGKDYKNLIEAHRQIVEQLTISSNIVNINPVTSHYQLADQIISKSHSLDEYVALGNKSLNELLNYGMTEDEICKIINEIRNNKNAR